jgi:6-pyruvoyltetrahydropterin/6-carboxytetrahydropterin synthase
MRETVAMLWLTREIRFAIAPEAGTPPERASANTWAGWPAATGLAPYLRLRATLAGDPDPVTGYLCDIKDIDELLQATTIPLAGELLRARGAQLLAEDLVQALWHRLPHDLLPGARLMRLQLLPTPYTLYTIQRDQSDMIQYTEQFEFSASHRLHCAEMTEQQNRDYFGKCNNPNGHGHNYVVDVTVATETLDRRRLGEVVKACVLDRFDHKHLNEDTAEFGSLNPTVENITRAIWQLLADALQPQRLLAVRVYETPKTWAEYRGE